MSLEGGEGACQPRRDSTDMTVAVNDKYILLDTLREAILNIQRMDMIYANDKRRSLCARCLG